MDKVASWRYDLSIPGPSHGALLYFFPISHQDEKCAGCAAPAGCLCAKEAFVFLTGTREGAGSVRAADAGTDACPQRTRRRAALCAACAVEAPA